MVLGRFQPSRYYGLGCGPNTNIEKPKGQRSILGGYLIVGTVKERSQRIIIHTFLQGILSSISYKTKTCFGKKYYLASPGFPYYFRG